MPKKITHLVSEVPARDRGPMTPTDHIKASPIGVYGRKQLNEIKRAAEQAGVQIRVSKVSKEN